MSYLRFSYYCDDTKSKMFFISNATKLKNNSLTLEEEKNLIDIIHTYGLYNPYVNDFLNYVLEIERYDFLDKFNFKHIEVKTDDYILNKYIQINRIEERRITYILRNFCYNPKYIFQLFEIYNNEWSNSYFLFNIWIQASMIDYTYWENGINDMDFLKRIKCYSLCIKNVYLFIENKYLIDLYNDGYVCKPFVTCVKFMQEFYVHFKQYVMFDYSKLKFPTTKIYNFLVHDGHKFPFSVYNLLVNIKFTNKQKKEIKTVGYNFSMIKRYRQFIRNTKEIFYNDDISNIVYSYYNGIVTYKKVETIVKLSRQLRMLKNFSYEDLIHTKKFSNLKILKFVDYIISKDSESNLLYRFLADYKNKKINNIFLKLLTL